MEWLWIGSVLLILALSMVCQKAAYRSGVTDGFGAAREPGNPYYRGAWRIIREAYPDLEEEDV